MNEIWKKIPGLPYEASSLGRIRNLKGDVLSGSNLKGYVRYDLSVNGKRVVKLGHILVADAFLPIEDNSIEINHKDGNKSNNSVANLERCTHQENLQHAVTELGFKPVNKRKVKCIETGIVYDSVLDAEKQTGISNSCIWRCCKGLRKTTHNTHWEFV